MGTRLEPTADGGTKITCIGQVDPKGSIPTSMKNHVAKKQSKKAFLIAEAYRKRFIKS